MENTWKNSYLKLFSQLLFHKWSPTGLPARLEMGTENAVAWLLSCWGIPSCNTLKYPVTMPDSLSLIWFLPLPPSSVNKWLGKSPHPSSTGFITSSVTGHNQSRCAPQNPHPSASTPEPHRGVPEPIPVLPSRPVTLSVPDLSLLL